MFLDLGEELPLCDVEIFSAASMMAASLFSFSATPSAIVMISLIPGFDTAAEIFFGGSDSFSHGHSVGRLLGRFGETA